MAGAGCPRGPRAQVGVPVAGGPTGPLQGGGDADAQRFTETGGRQVAGESETRGVPARVGGQAVAAELACEGAAERWLPAAYRARHRRCCPYRTQATSGADVQVLHRGFPAQTPVHVRSSRRRPPGAARTPGTSAVCWRGLLCGRRHGFPCRTRSPSNRSGDTRQARGKRRGHPAGEASGRCSASRSRVTADVPRRTAGAWRHAHASITPLLPVSMSWTLSDHPPLAASAAAGLPCAGPRPAHPHDRRFGPASPFGALHSERAEDYVVRQYGPTSPQTPSVPPGATSRADGRVPPLRRLRRRRPVRWRRSPSRRGR